MKQLLPMSLRQLNKLDVLRRVGRKEMTQMEAARLLEITDRQIRRKLQRLTAEGPASLQHGLKGRPSNNTLPGKETDRIETLLRERYPDFGPTFAAEKLVELNGISRDPKTIRSIQIRLGLWKSRTMRKQVTHRFWRERRSTFGEMQQFDGSYHNWFEGRGGIDEACLLAAIDDATGRITHAWFALHEGVLPVMDFWLSYSRIQGIPKAVYLDRFSTYSMNMKLAAENPDTLTQFERAAKEVGLEVIHALSPQAKGRVENLFGTLQDRLVKEMRLRNIRTIEEANRFLTDTFIPSFNRKFGKEPKRPGDLHRKPSPRELEDILPYIFCRREPRTLRNDFTVPYNKQWFQLLPTSRLAMRPKEDVFVHEFPNGDFHLLVRGKQANFHELPERYRQRDSVREKIKTLS